MDGAIHPFMKLVNKLQIVSIDLFCSIFYQFMLPNDHSQSQTRLGTGDAPRNALGMR